MKTREECFEKDWAKSGERYDIEHRLKYLGSQNIFEGQEVDLLLDRLNEIRNKLKKFYQL